MEVFDDFSYYGGQPPSDRFFNINRGDAARRAGEHKNGPLMMLWPNGELPTEIVGTTRLVFPTGKKPAFNSLKAYWDNGGDKFFLGGVMHKQAGKLLSGDTEFYQLLRDQGKLLDSLYLPRLTAEFEEVLMVFGRK